MVELALGTVQFGLAYGIAGRGMAVPEEEVRAILRRAFDGGVRTLDTAAAYGDIEPRLASLCGDLPFQFVSKIPPVPAGAGPEYVAEWVSDQVTCSMARLGPRLRAMMFHRAGDVLDLHGALAWKAAADLIDGRSIALGVSCYGVDELRQVAIRFPVDVAQLPGNAFDQGLVRSTAPMPGKTVELHLRSAFLQGLLLMPRERAVERLPGAAVALQRWHDWCSERNLKPLPAALGFAKGLPGVRKVVVGVDTVPQLEEILAAWQATPPLSDPDLACNDSDIIDPRRWRTA